MTIERAIEILDPEHREHYDSLETVNEACCMGMAALEKQRPKKPKNKTGRYSDYHCPNCNARIKSGMGSSERYRNNFCNHCGQAIDWRR